MVEPGGVGDVRNSLGNVIASGAPESASGWTIDLAPAVLSGRYTIEVEPVGWLTASTGFTLYGSLGAYEVAINAPQGPTPLPPGTSAFTPVTPVRLVDSRDGVGAVGRVAAGRQVVVQVADGVRVPADATAAVVNVAAVNPSAPGFLTVYPCSDGVPDTSTLNYVAGQTVANTTIAALVVGSAVCVDVRRDRHPGRHHGLAQRQRCVTPHADRSDPCGRHPVERRGSAPRCRPDPGCRSQRRRSRRIERGRRQRHCGQRRRTGIPHRVPVRRRAAEHLDGELRRQRGRPNNTIVGLSGGRICVFSDQATDVLVDLLGSFAAAGLAYQPTAPVRVLDTRRTGTLAAGAVAAYSVGAAASVHRCQEPPTSTSRRPTTPWMAS